MKLAVLLSVFVSVNLFANTVDLSPERGRAVAPITWVDNSGRTRELTEFAGFPVILLPIYTRCQTACRTNVEHLKRALSDSTSSPTQFRVLIFSFDDTDTPASLTAYRNRERIPLEWFVGTARSGQIEVLLESLGFQYGKAGTEFMHTNAVFFLDSKLRIAKWIYGTDYFAGDVDGALKIAAGQSDWLGRHAEWLYAILLFTGSLLCVVLVHHLRQLAYARGSDGTGMVQRMKRA